MTRYRVYIGLVPTGYMNPAAIENVVRDGMVFCGTDLFRKRDARSVVLKADVTAADPGIARYAYTHPEVTGAAISQLLSFLPAAKVAVMAGDGGYGFPVDRLLRLANGASDRFMHRGYHELERQHPGRVTVTSEGNAPSALYQLSKGDLLHAGDARSGDARSALTTLRVTNTVAAPLAYATSDVVVYCPKLKSDPFCGGFAGAVRLGWQGHGPDAERKVCDMLEIGNPDLIVSDGIVAAIGGSLATQRGHELGAILVSNNAVAHDWVAAQILNLDPLMIEHLKLAADRGWGPANGARIELGGAGAEGMALLRQKTRFWDMGCLPLEEFPAKFSRENPGLRFPFEILPSVEGRDNSGERAACLDWLYSSYDFVTKRAGMAKWPETAVAAGCVTGYPRAPVVFALGRTACARISEMTSSRKTWLRAAGMGLHSVKLKNGGSHLLLTLEKRVTHWRLSWMFFLFSLGRIRDPMFTLLARSPSLWPSPRRKARKIDVRLTCLLARNSWWALPRHSVAVDVSE